MEGRVDAETKAATKEPGCKGQWEPQGPFRAHLGFQGALFRQVQPLLGHSMVGLGAFSSRLSSIHSKAALWDQCGLGVWETPCAGGQRPLEW